MSANPPPEEKRSLPRRSAKNFPSYITDLNDSSYSGASDSGSSSAENDHRPQHPAGTFAHGTEEKNLQLAEITTKTLPAEIRDQPPCWLRSCLGRFDRYRGDLKPFGLWVRSCRVHFRPHIPLTASSCVICGGEQSLQPGEAVDSPRSFVTVDGKTFTLCSACYNDRKFQIQYFNMREVAPGEIVTSKKREGDDILLTSTRASQAKRKRSRKPQARMHDPSSSTNTLTHRHLAVTGGSLVVRIHAADPVETVTPERPVPVRVGTFVEYLEVLHKMQEDGLVTEDLQERLMEAFLPSEGAALVEAAVRHAMAQAQRLPLATALINRGRVLSSSITSGTSA